MSEQEQIESSAEELTLQDFTWSVTAANWFLIGIGAFIQDSIRAGGYAGGSDQFSVVSSGLQSVQLFLLP